MSKRWITILLVVTGVVAVSFTIFFDRMNSFLVMSGRPPLPASHCCILFATFISLFLIRNTEKAIKKATLFFAVFLACSYASLWIYNVGRNAARSDALGVFPIAIVFLGIVIVVISAVMSWLFKKIIFRSVNNVYQSSYFLLSAAFIIISISANSHNWTWIYPYYPQIVNQIIEHAVITKNGLECDKLENVYYVYEHDKEQSFFKYESLYNIAYFSDYASELCRTTLRAVLEHDLKVCFSEKYDEFMLDLREDARKNNSLADLQAWKSWYYGSPSFGIAKECRKYYVEQFPSESDDYKDFFDIEQPFVR